MSPIAIRVVRLLVGLVAILATWVGAAVITPVAAEIPADLDDVHAYTDDGARHSSLGVTPISERCPPSWRDLTTTYDAVGFCSHGDVARADGLTPDDVITDDGPTVLVQDASVGPTLGDGIEVTRGGLSSLHRWRVAAKTAPHVLPIGPGSQKAWTVLNRIDAKGARSRGTRAALPSRTRKAVCLGLPASRTASWT